MCIAAPLFARPHAVRVQLSRLGNPHNPHLHLRQMERNEDGRTDPSVPSPSDPPPNEATEIEWRPYNEWKGKPLARVECKKVDEILAVCEEPVDSDALARLATSTGGLLDDEVRQTACTSTNYLLVLAL